MRSGACCLEALGRLVSTGRSAEFGAKRREILLASTHAPGIPASACRALDLLVSRPKREYALAPRGINRVARSSAARKAAAGARAEALLAVRLAPRSPWGPIAAALACEDLGRLKEAAAWYGRAIRLRPKEGWLFLARADARRRDGDLAGFVADATAAHYLDEGAGVFRFAVADPREASARAAVGGATRFLRRHPRAAWALASRADLKRFPQINDFPGALADFEAAAKLAPREAWILAYLSRARISGGDAAGALEAVSRAARLRPGCAWIRAWKGEVLRRLGRPRESLRELDAALRLDPGYEFTRAWRGGALRLLGRSDEALDELSLARALDPSCAWTQVETSLALRALGRVEEALSALEDARRLDPKSAWCPRPSGASAAIAELDAYLKKSPTDARAWAWRGETLLRAGSAAGAEKSLARAKSLPWARAARGEALLALGRARAAAREFDAALRAEPALAEARAKRGRARLEAGDVRGALADLAEAARREPRAAWIHADLGRAALAARRWDRAREAFRQAAALERGEPRALVGEARALIGAGRRRAAEPLLRAALSRAEQLTASGRHADAAALATEILAADPRRREAYAVRAEAYRCLCRHAEAVADHDSLVRLERGTAEARLSRGAAKRAAGDFAGALADARASGASPSSLLLQAEALRNLGRESEALAAVARACARAPRLSRAWLLRAKAARQAGAHADALAWARRAVRLDPRDAKARGWEADVLRALGRRREAARAVERGLLLAPAVAWLRLLRAELRRDAGDAAGAVADWSEALRLDPRGSGTYDFLGADAPAAAADPGRAWAWAWRGAARRAAGDARGAKADFARAAALAPGLFDALS